MIGKNPRAQDKCLTCGAAAWSAYAAGNILKTRILLSQILPVVLLAVGASVLAPAARADNTVEFGLTDNPGNWFQVKNGAAIGGSRSIAVATPGVQVKFSFQESQGVHTTTSLIWPTGAAGMPFDTGTPGEGEHILTTPGLYVFFCKIHDYMLAAVIVDDPTTPGLDLGDSITLANGITIPTSSDLATRLLRFFFIDTNPANWQDHSLAK